MIAARLHPVVAVLEDNLLGFPVMHGRQEGAGTAVMARDEMEHQLGIMGRPKNRLVRGHEGQGGSLVQVAGRVA